MTGNKPAFCTICLRSKRKSEEWFLLVENRWTDRLKILSWQDELGSHPAFHAACGAAHVQELVIHWMTTGTLDYPFARRNAGADSRASLKPVRHASVRGEADITGAEVLGELAVHRESIERILVENPSSLGGILSALKAALPEQVEHSEMAQHENPERDTYAFTEA